ncbi:MAG: hypothetical protein D6679_04500 [Candidatus Hydrogenedentota bacterium]|nr:MAG: hypothetical protein D6679_04500 [Candidatus Hydrogenedentota bacterium]
MALIAGAVRWIQMGDLSPQAKALESGLIAVAVLGVGVVIQIILLTLEGGKASSAPVRSRGGPTKTDISSIRPEELANIESELPEVEKPEVTGVHGRPPEELAQVLREMAGEEEKGE